MMITQEIKDILKKLLKNDLITISEIALFKARKDKEKLVEIIERVFKARNVIVGDICCEVINEDEVFALIDYIEDEPLTLTLPSTQPTYPYTPVCPNYPYNPTTGDNPWWKQDVIYCEPNNSNSIQLPGDRSIQLPDGGVVTCTKN